VAMNLCDVDGNNQFLELVTYHPPTALTANNTKNTKKRIGWVHIGFTQPTHMRIQRDPLDLGKFSFSYRPDNRETYAVPFKDLASGFVGKMEVGVSMTSPEAYRYAEFYNVSMEACPSSCNDASGKQVICGDITTACGNKLKCNSSCAGGGVCNVVPGTCMACPEMTLTTQQSGWECGTITQVCANPTGQQMQLIRDIGTVKTPPSSLHFCKNNSWHCVGQSKWVYLAEGKDCGTVTDNCNNEVKLFDCQLKNDVCESHKCKCTPTTFNEKFNCGSSNDGCGRVVEFGALAGKCAGATDVCNANKCCTPKTKANFSAGYQCGQEPDGCGGFVDFNQAPATAFFKKAPVGRRRSFTNYYSGQRGIEFKASTDGTVTRLARGLENGKTKLETTSRVSLWLLDQVGQHETAKRGKEIAHVDVGPTSNVDGKDGYAWTPLPTSVKIEKGNTYRVVMKIWRNMKDKYTQAYMHGSDLSSSFEAKFGSFKGLVQASNEVGFPVDTYVNGGQGMGLTNFELLENDGCGAGIWTCQTNHSCTKTVVKGFIVEAGPCVVDGNCVTSSNYGSNSKYPNGERCTIKTPSAGVLKFEKYDVENGYDYLTVGGASYRYSKPPQKTLKAPETVSWRSDGSVTNKGFKMCISSSLLQEGDEPEAEEHEAQELSENELAQLPDEEREHATSKYQQKREETAAEVEAASKAEKLDDEMRAMADAAALLESDAQEIQGVELDEDEMALPDLTRKE